MLPGWVKTWYGIIKFYYKLQSQITYFIQSREYRLQILRLLQGRVYNRKEEPVLDALRKFIETVEKSDRHMSKDQLTDISND